jgi:hypothetical protein
MPAFIVEFQRLQLFEAEVEADSKEGAEAELKRRLEEGELIISFHFDNDALEITDVSLSQDADEDEEKTP